MNEKKERDFASDSEEKSSKEKRSKRNRKRFGKGDSDSKGYKNSRRSGARSGGDRRGSNGSGSSNDTDSSVPLHSSNDINWYAKSPEQVRNVASLSFYGSVGKPLTDAKVNSPALAAPGVMKIGYIPTWGNPRLASDPMNIAAFDTYSFVRHANSGSRNYDYADLWQYLAIVEGAYSLGGFITRACAVLNAYSPFNQYLPKALFEAMGLDFTDFIKNIAPFRTFVNNYASMVNIYAAPKNLPIFARHYWACANVYADSKSPWSQLYVMVPEVYPIYNKVTGNVDYLPFIEDSLDPHYSGTSTNQLLTYDQLVDICTQVVNSIYEVEDFAIMSGDVMKAFGGDVFNIGGLAVDTVLYPVYDPEVLVQISNSLAIGDIRHMAEHGSRVLYSIGENTNDGALVVAHKADLDQPGLNTPIDITGRIQTYSPVNALTRLVDDDYLLNVPEDAPTPELVMEATRLMALSTLGTQDDDNKHYVTRTLHECGADVVTTYQMFVFANTAGGGRELLSSPKFTTDGLVTDIGTLLVILSNIEHFDWHPRLYIGGDGDVQYNYILPFTDTHTVTVADNATLARIHEVANLSLFNVVYGGPASFSKK